MVLPGLLLTIVLGLLSQRVKAKLRTAIYRRRALLLAGPLVLTCIFMIAAWNAGAAGARLFLLVLAYTLAPTLFILLPQGDLTAILLLWLPLELAAGASLVPKAVQGYLHAVAYGVGIVLALWLFVIYRGLKGVKYNLPRGPRDLIYPAVGFAFLAPVLGVLGVALGFMPHMHALHVAWYKAVLRYVTIFCATALPEEILFRGLIQNWLMQHFGATNKTLLAAGFIFGCSHLNNGPLPLPNWRYMILATIAGVVFGKVFQKSSSILASVSLHAAVDTAKYAFF